MCNIALCICILLGRFKDRSDCSWLYQKAEELYLYVILHRVRKLSGLYLPKPLDENDISIGEVPRELAQYEAHLCLLEADVLQQCGTHMERLGL